LTVDSSWSINPTNTSQFYITNYAPMSYPYFLMNLGGEGGQVDFGTASGGTTADLDDAGRTFGTNTYQNKYVYVYEGSAIGQYSKIASNTDTKLVFTTAFTTAPTGTSKFCVVDREDQILKMMYVRAYLWLFASDPNTSAHVTEFANLWENLANLYQQEPTHNPFMNVPYYASTIQPKGKSVFDVSVSALPAMV